MYQPMYHCCVCCAFSLEKVDGEPFKSNADAADSCPLFVGSLVNLSKAHSAAAFSFAKVTAKYLHMYAHIYKRYRVLLPFADLRIFSQRTELTHVY